MARHFGVRWRLVSQVTVHDRPHRFVDEQVQGPFRWMRHARSFEAPFGPLGAVVGRAALAPYLRRRFEHRAAHVRSVAEN